MQTITPEKFKELVAMDPAWAAKLTQPVEIRQFVELKESPITHLSPLLHFRGKSPEGMSADFIDCANLKTVEGFFEFRPRFLRCGIEKINTEGLHIQNPSPCGEAATFYKCEKLKVAEGTFPGFVNFSQSGIETIDPERLIITGTNPEGEAAGFSQCKQLKIAQGTFPGRVLFLDSGIERIDPEKLVILKPSRNGNAASFIGCKNLETIEGNFPGRVDFSLSNVNRVNPKKFRIEKPNQENQYLRITHTPLNQNPVQVKLLASVLFGYMTSKELKEIARKLDPKDFQLNSEVLWMVEEKLKTAARKNAAVEIQID